MLDIITAVKEKFNAQKYPVEGPTYILPDGSFLDIIGTFDSKTSFEDFPCHREVEDWLIENDLSNFSTEEMSGSPTLEALGAIRCNDLKENNFIELSNIRPTSAQYESLENWIYDNAEHRSSLIVATPSFQQYKDYDPEDVEYIIKRIKRYYASGNLYENMIENKSLEEAKKKKRKKKKQKALGWWQTFTPDAGNVLMNNAFFNHAMGNTNTDEFMADVDAAMGEFSGDCSSGMSESLENITSSKVIEKEATNLSMKDIAGIKSKNKVTEDMKKEAFRFYGKDKEGNDIEYKIDGISFTDAIDVFMRVYPDVEDWDVDTLTEAIEESQFGVHQFSTESIIFRGTQEECGQYIDDRPELWDDAEVYEIKPDDKHYIKEGQKQPLVEDGEEKVYQVIVKYKDELTQKLEARIAKNRKDLEYQLSTDKDVEWYDFDEKQFNEDKEEAKICCICGKEYSGYGNNAEPVKAGKCCDDCNLSEVIPARIAKINVSREHSMTEIFQDLNKIKK